MGMLPRRPISDEDLHAYLDGALEAERLLHIARHLARHPPAAARAESFRAQNAAMHALFDEILREPVPRRLRRLTQRHPARSALCRAFARTFAALGTPTPRTDDSRPPVRSAART
jgi:anti-sigma factor RsiW